jgi:N-acetylglucosaminyldiphosphoundecaprenol N-acetyl-beta-D-mannosaminyltransferase
VSSIPHDTVELFSLPFSVLDIDQVVDAVTSPVRHVGTRLLITCNLDHLQNLRRSEQFRTAYEHSWMITADGWPIVTYAKLGRGITLPHVTGADLLPCILRRLDPLHHRPFFVASTDEVAEKLAILMKSYGFALHEIGTNVPPFGFESDAKFGEDLAMSIRENGTTHVFMGVGAPKSENWVHQQRDRLGNTYAFGFGAALDFAADVQQRAPRWMQQAGLEWFFRMLGQPTRLAPRYIRNAVTLVFAVQRDRATRRRFQS